MSAIENPRPSSSLTRAERMAELAASRTSPAPLYKVGDRVTFEGCASVVEDVRIVGGTVHLTVSNYATRSLIGEKHSGLAPAE